MAPFGLYLFNDPSISGPSLLTWIGFPLESALSFILAVILPLTLAAIFFAGPIFLLVQNPRWAQDFIEQWRCETLPMVRNVLVAPLCEEMVFRACVCPILLAGGWSVSSTVFISPLLFGLAHMHHMLGMMRSRGLGMRESLLNACFQLSYTTVFGCLTGLLFLRTGHTVACILVHSFANIMGFPDLSWINQPHPQKSLISALFLGGLVMYVILFMPLTRPDLYGSFFYTFHRSIKGNE
jgi:prenyl protein peptidase